MRLAAVALVAAFALAGCTDDGTTAELCDALADTGDVSGVFRGFDPADTSGALERLRSARVTLGDLKDAAPGDVADELQVEIDYVQALIDALEEVPDGDPTSSVTAVREVTEAHPDVEEAAAALEEFARTRC